MQKERNEKNLAFFKQVLIKRAAFFSVALSTAFFQTVIFVPDSCAQEAVPQATGPIDIQANEQEFQESVVVAKGDVTVTYKDSIVKAPEAKLFRDPNGQPQKAVFIGHPYLTQNDNKISADTLIFEIAQSKFIAQGHAHSEVSSEGDNNQLESPPGAKKETKKPAKNSLVASAPATQLMSAKKTGNEKQPFAWPKASDDQSPFQKPGTNKEIKSGTQIASSNTETSKAFKKTNSAPDTAANKSGSTGSEKIITDSDYQEYEKESGKFDAVGHVHVVHGEITVYADKLKLVYGTDNKPETALFTGHVNAFQGTNNTQAEIITYYLSTKRLQATGNVRSRMIQKKDESKSENGTKKISSIPNGTAGTANAATSTGMMQNSEDPVIVVSDAQDINQNTGKMSADGNVRVYYQDMMGAGPKVLLLRNADGRAEKVIFTERSQISQPGKRWIADRITMAIATKKILAEGNTKAFIIQGGGPAHKPSPQNNSALAMRTQEKAASTPGQSKQKSGSQASKSEIY